jgi:adenine phosphoribosyltransferase
MDLRKYIRDVLDFKPGITFFDITPLLSDPKAFSYTIDALAERYQDSGANKIVAAEARGFIFGAPLAYKMNIGFIPVRKPGKLPYKTTSVSYDLEYGTDSLCMHVDAVAPGDNVLIIDDLLATGGTTGGMIQLVQQGGGKIVGIGFLIELGFLNGPSKLEGIPHQCLLKL